ncbi:multidrug efflux SMR transporter [Bdellovibrio sp. 22V]|uniref:DMT family transporter n=1 Tax=Bdellovibrio TaxID=958 RepID=UPI002543E6E3|nr:multidrug efflux SMR transporter [Bdellovibrio sp. 22V]WII71894.1 multidrug efflux SMR transporter [Bdellovibrio sp. 22V]
MSNTTAWLVLLVAGILEFVWATGLKYSDGFTKLGPSIFTLVTMGISFYLLSLAMRVLPVGVSYTVWTGIGAVGAIVIGFVVFKEPVSLMKLVFLGMIVGGILGLKFVES